MKRGEKREAKESALHTKHPLSFPRHKQHWSSWRFIFSLLQPPVTTMASLSLQRVHELTFHVESPILDKTTASASLTTVASAHDSSSWTVTLTLSGPILNVKVDCYRYDVTKNRHVPDGSAYTFMHIVPHKNQEISTTSASIQASNGTQSVTGKWCEHWFLTAEGHEQISLHQNKDSSALFLSRIGKKKDRSIPPR